MDSHFHTVSLYFIWYTIIITHICTLAHRFRTFYDFGFVSLDILSVYAEDSGQYTCVAENALGQAQTNTQFTCQREFLTKHGGDDFVLSEPVFWVSFFSYSFAHQETLVRKKNGTLTKCCLLTTWLSAERNQFSS